MTLQKIMNSGQTQLHMHLFSHNYQRKTLQKSQKDKFNSPSLFTCEDLIQKLLQNDTIPSYEATKIYRLLRGSGLGSLKKWVRVEKRSG